MSSSPCSIRAVHYRDEIWTVELPNGQLGWCTARRWHCCAPLVHVTIPGYTPKRRTPFTGGTT
ncbi:hypothetical protein RHMOL_Rhmol07G0322900 [Rhododendron molle]|uniref:Uncharacterized protein n=1 Tax=Rhododendron molle TaxID=49168 RepID=A0ACC0N913_RHOML|nr:hypothetical protein RHMOL_Rhmol07G0322900 [Rhododendron molle]